MADDGPRTPCGRDGCCGPCSCCVKRCCPTESIRQNAEVMGFMYGRRRSAAFAPPLPLPPTSLLPLSPLGLHSSFRRFHRPTLQTASGRLCSSSPCCRSCPPSPCLPSATVGATRDASTLTRATTTGMTGRGRTTRRQEAPRATRTDASSRTGAYRSLLLALVPGYVGGRRGHGWPEHVRRARRRHGAIA